MIAILCVVIGHIAPLFDVNWLMNIIYSFHMALFFTLSTYLFSIKKTEINIRNKFYQLILPYISICFLSIILKSFSLEAINGYLISETRWGYWFLPTLFILYILLYIILKFTKNTFLFWIISTLIFLLLFILKKYSSYIVVDFFCLRHLLTYWPFFILGYIFNSTRIINNKYIMYFSLLVWIIILFLFFHYNYTNELSRMIGRFFSVIFLINIFKFYINRNIPYITIVGKSSLTIYLFHYYLLIVIKKVSFEFSNSYFNLCLVLLFSILIIILCVLLQSKFLTKYYITRFLFLGKNSK